MERKTSKYLAICPQEFQHITKQELAELGAKNIEDGYKAVSFECDTATSYKIHLSLSTASKLMLIVREGAAKDRNAIFFQATKVKWLQYFKPTTQFVVHGVAGDRGPDAPTSNQISKAVREGIQKNFIHHGYAPPQVDLKNPQLAVYAYYHGKRLTLSIDTSGKSLHKRGYKCDSHPAPIKEHIAAAILKAAGYTGNQPLWDPMCGSGTLPIEASYIALNKAALIHRKKGEFGIETLANFDKTIWREVQESIRQQKHSEPESQIFASDLNQAYSEMTQKHALRARVERHIETSAADFFKCNVPAKTGLLVCNLPYGDRMSVSEDTEDREFYRQLGTHLKQNFSGWRAAFITSAKAPWQEIGLKPTKKIKMENGGIPCQLLIYDMYEGSRKGKKIHQDNKSAN